MLFIINDERPSKCFFQKSLENIVDLVGNIDQFNQNMAYEISHKNTNGETVIYGILSFSTTSYDLNRWKKEEI